MFVSQELRKNNIAEYILYMWQIEDIIRAHDCYLPKLRREYISRYECSDELRDEITDWYSNIIRMMTEEGCRESGHIQINNVVVQSLTELHAQLMASPKFPYYNSQFYKVLPFIVELRNKGSKDVSEIETCLSALYGVMMLRLQKQQISDDTMHAIKEISTFIGMLSDYYKKDKEEGLEFE